jgi:ketosteroid isomerase-like protein
MPDRETMLRTIDQAMGARQRGDKQALAEFLAPDATYQLNGTAELLRGMPIGPEGAEAAVHSLMDRFTFHRVERADTLIDGNQAALRWRIQVSTDGGEPVETELLHLWTIDDQGRVASVLEFGDTALIARMLG